MEETAMAYVDWSIQGYSIINCNWDFGCPCQFNSLPTHGDCRAMNAARIERGHFGDVDLSGVAFCVMFAWPCAIHLGGGEVFAVISDNAMEAQRNAILTVLSGKETAPGATIYNVFAPTFVKVHDPNGSTRAEGPVKLSIANAHSHLYNLNMTTNGVV
jgi:hypothetical protein